MDNGEDGAATLRLTTQLAATRILIADLESELAGIAESTAAVPDDEHDPEGSTVGLERARVGALLDQAEQSVADVQAALERCHRGAYGWCAACGQAIAPERLEALPATALCVSCAAAGR